MVYSVKLGNRKLINRRKDRKYNNGITEIKKEVGIRENIVNSTKTGKKKSSAWRGGMAIKQNMLMITDRFFRT